MKTALTKLQIPAYNSTKQHRAKTYKILKFLFFPLQLSRQPNPTVQDKESRKTRSRASVILWLGAEKTWERIREIQIWNICFFFLSFLFSFSRDQTENSGKEWPVTGIELTSERRRWCRRGQAKWRFVPAELLRVHDAGDGAAGSTSCRPSNWVGPPCVRSRSRALSDWHGWTVLLQSIKQSTVHLRPSGKQI